MTVTNNVFVKDPSSQADEIMIAGDRATCSTTILSVTPAATSLGNPNNCGLSSNETLTNNVLQARQFNGGQAGGAIAQDYNLIPAAAPARTRSNGSPTYVRVAQVPRPGPGFIAAVPWVLAKLQMVLISERRSEYEWRLHPAFGPQRLVRLRGLEFTKSLELDGFDR